MPFSCTLYQTAPTNESEGGHCHSTHLFKNKNIHTVIMLVKMVAVYNLLQIYKGNNVEYKNIFMNN